LRSVSRRGGVVRAIRREGEALGRLAQTATKKLEERLVLNGALGTLRSGERRGVEGFGVVLEVSVQDGSSVRALELTRAQPSLVLGGISYAARAS
jgi:hypothetical protein